MPTTTPSTTAPGTASSPPSTARATLRSPRALKSYLAKISDAVEPNGLPAFAAFPKDTEFEGQDRGEHIVLFLRQHPAVFISKIFIVIGMILIPLLFVPLLGYSKAEISLSDVSFGMGIIVLWVMLIVTFITTNFLKWFFNANIVTNQRIIDIDFDRLFFHRVSEAQLERIEDVSHTSVGMWATIFDFGDVFIQTAAEQREFEFTNIPRPRDVQDTINDLLELKQGDR